MSYLIENSTAQSPTIPVAESSTRSSEAPKRILAKGGELAVLPTVVFKVLELSATVDNAATELEKAIEVDPSFSLKLLTAANSSYYALSRKVSSLRDAIVYLGFRSVKEIALTVGVFDMFVGKTDEESLRRRAWWRTSIDTAIACRCIADRCHKLYAADAYTCGLLHYVGKSLLDRFGTGDFKRVEGLMSRGFSEKDAEREVFGCNHEEVATEAGTKWGLPANVVASFSYSAKPRANEHSHYSACVCLGNMIAKMALSGNVCLDLFPEWAFDDLQISPETTQELYNSAIELINSATGMQL